MKVKANVHINAPIAKVFEAFSDVSKIEERIEGITKVDILSRVKKGEGVSWRETRQMFGKEATEEMTMTGYEKPNSYRVEAHSHGMHYVSDYTFTEEDGGTTVSMVFDGRPQNVKARVGMVLGAVFIPMTKKMLKADMTNLKEYLEK